MRLRIRETILGMVLDRKGRSMVVNLGMTKSGKRRGASQSLYAVISPLATFSSAVPMLISGTYSLRCSCVCNARSMAFVHTPCAVEALRRLSARGSLGPS